jgi:hypothetical protein
MRPDLLVGCFTLGDELWCTIWLERVCPQGKADALGRRIMAISPHPWVIAQPYWTKSLQAALTYEES